MDENVGTSMNDKGDKKLWWIVGIVVFLFIAGYFVFKWMGSNGSTSTDADAATLNESDIADIPQTGEELIDKSVTDSTSDVDLGEDLI